LVQRLELVLLQNKIMNAETAEHVGILKLKIYLIGLIDMWRHPKYYKELRKRNKLAESRQPVVGGQQQSDQVISPLAKPVAGRRAPGPGQTRTSSGSSLKRQAAGDKRHTASSAKRQASSPE
jgi:hypothetical protein